MCCNVEIIHSSASLKGELICILYKAFLHVVTPVAIMHLLVNLAPHIIPSLYLLYWRRYSCFCLDPNKRITPDAALQHEWIMDTQVSRLTLLSSTSLLQPINNHNIDNATNSHLAGPLGVPNKQDQLADKVTYNYNLSSISYTNSKSNSILKGGGTSYVYNHSKDSIAGGIISKESKIQGATSTFKLSNVYNNETGLLPAIGTTSISNSSQYVVTNHQLISNIKKPKIISTSIKYNNKYNYKNRF